MKNKNITVKITEMEFPDIGLGTADGYAVKVKGALIGQTISARIKKKRKGVISAALVEVVERGSIETESKCSHQGSCGGCFLQTVSYENQLVLKEKMMLDLFRKNQIEIGKYKGIFGSPEIFHYRNKMEFSFGDMGKDCGLSLGLRKKNSRYEVVFVCGCVIVDKDYRIILKKTLEFFSNHNLSFYNNRRHQGVLRHLVVRKSKTMGSIIVNLVTTSGYNEEIINMYKDMLLCINIEGEITGVIHTVNDGLADMVKLDDMRLLYGKNYFNEKILGLTFKITPESFFQTNTRGAELLYSKVLELAGCCKTVYDLYCGTGTITQIMAKNSERAIGIELVPEAVEAAVANAKENGVNNARFICGDVLEILDKLDEKPDLIVLDPPRDGIHPKAIKKIINFNAKKIVYISCKGTSLVRDLKEFLQYGYRIEESFIVDMFPGCAHLETVVSLSLCEITG